MWFRATFTLLRFVYLLTLVRDVFLNFVSISSIASSDILINDSLLVSWTESTTVGLASRARWKLNAFAKYTKPTISFY